MKELIRIKIYFTSGQSVEYHTNEYSDSNNDLCFWQGKTEISVNHKNIACLEIEDVEVPSKEEENKSDVKDEFEPGYVYFKCMTRGGCLNGLRGFREKVDPICKTDIAHNLKFRHEIENKKCPKCGTDCRILYV